MSSLDPKPVIIWLLTGCFLIFIMVMVGGITRLTHSGLSMVEWNLIMGAIPPIGDKEWQSAFEQYQQFPEFQKVNSDFTLQEFKSIFWWEYIHRMLGRLIGLVFLIPFVVFLIKKRIDKRLLPKLLVLFGLGAFQGFLGWYMVKSGLVNNPAVSHYRLAAHLLTAFLTFGFSLWLALGLFYEDEKKKSDFPLIRKYSFFLLFMVTLQIVYGAFVAGLRGGLVYNTFPKMGKYWVPDTLFMLDPVILNAIGSPVGTQFLHRWLAVGVVITVFWIWRKSLRCQLSYSQRLSVNGSFVVVLLQFILGALTLVQAVPIHLALMHQLGAFFLFGFCVLMVHRFRST